MTAAESATEWFADPDGEPVELHEPDPSWPRQFEGFRAQLAAALGDVALRIDHIGSTAVPDMPAKATIDIQVSVRDLAAEAEYRPPIERLGWLVRAREADHLFFRPPAGEPRVVHVHVCQAGSEWERRHLLFRDFLRADAKRAAAYAALKRDLAARLGRVRTDYTRAKDPFIAETHNLAERWAAETGWGP